MDDNSNKQPVAPVQPPQPVQPQAQPAVQPQAVQPQPVQAQLVQSYQPQAPQPVQAQQPAGYAQYAPTPAPKKSNAVLFIIIGAVVALLAALLVGFFVIKGNVDKVADTYTSSLNTYIADLSAAAADSSNDVTTLTDNMNGVREPKLDDAFLSGISSKYSDAKKAGEDLKSKVTGFNDRAAEIVAVKNFDEVNTGKIDEMRDVMNTSSITADNAVSRFKQARTILEETLTLTKDAKLPSDLSSAQSDLAAAYEAELSAINLVISAYQAKNVDDYQSALTKMSSASLDEGAAWKQFATYLSTLSSKVDTLSSDIEALKGNA